jgi:hypothetical protein
MIVDNHVGAIGGRETHRDLHYEDVFGREVMLDFRAVLLRFVSHLAVFFVPDFTRFCGELKRAIHRVNTLGFNSQ